MQTVRPVQGSEREQVRALVAAAGLPLDGHDDAAVVLVAVDGDDVVGTVALERHDDAVLLRSLAVQPARRGTGTGAALVEAALREADGPVALLTETAQEWFPRFGFRRVARTALPAALVASAELRGACPASAVAMVRD